MALDSVEPLTADACEEITDGPAENRTPNPLIKRCDEGETTAPQLCGNDITETGEECDGTDASFCPNQQCNLDCTCPVCGNDIQEPGEQCDGNDDGNCPGACQSDCTCGGG